MLAPMPLDRTVSAVCLTRPTRPTHPHRRLARSWLAIALSCSQFLAAPASATSILFVGNSFTYGEPAGAAPTVQTFRPATVRDLNGTGLGGVPALFKAMTLQAGLEYEVSLETAPGKGLDFHYRHRLPTLIGRYDKVVLQSYSTLDAARPGNPATLINYTGLLSTALRKVNPQVELMLMSTWSRADLTYSGDGAWRGKPITQMALDLRCGYDAAAAAWPALISRVIPVGEVWNGAIGSGLADPNPYDGIAPGQIDLWAPDHYHASRYGYYLAALTVFGAVTGKDPAMFGATDPVALELAIDGTTAAALQRQASAQLALEARRRLGDGCAAMPAAQFTSRAIPNAARLNAP